MKLPLSRAPVGLKENFMGAGMIGNPTFRHVQAFKLQGYSKSAVVYDDVFCLKGIGTVNKGHIIKWTSRTLVLSSPLLTLRRRTYSFC